MKREERLRTRREQYRARRNRETPEQREERLARRREYDRGRYAQMTVDQRRALSQRRRERVVSERRRQGEQVAATDCNDSAVTRQLPSFDDPFIVTIFNDILNQILAYAVPHTSSIDLEDQLLSAPVPVYTINSKDTVTSVSQVAS